MKKVHIIGGGTINHVRNHLALCAPAYGTTAKALAFHDFGKMEVLVHLTKMASSHSKLETNQDVSDLVDQLVADFDTKVIIFNVAMCDFEGAIITGGDFTGNTIKNGKHAKRLETNNGVQNMFLMPSEKVVSKIRKTRKDIFLVAFKTTCGATEQEQYLAGLNLLKKSSCNLVLANDVETRLNMIITPEEAKYCVTTDRDVVLDELVAITNLRSQLAFTRSNVIAGKLIPWDAPEVFPSLRTIVEYCIEQNAYKPFNGATVGHFACKIDDRTFLTSVRKSNFNDLAKNGLVKVVVDGEDSVTAYGAKPSVGGQSQRIIFNEHDAYDCIVHFHCPIKPESEVPVVSQREFECGSHACGQNTSNGLKRFGNLSAVMLDNHGPNIVFHHSINPQEVIDFINNNFELALKTGGPVTLNLETA